MAPKKRKADDSLKLSSSSPTRRMTRSSTHQATRSSAAAAPAASTVAKLPAEPRKKKARKPSKEKEKSNETLDSENAEAPKDAIAGSKTIVVEHCKQCNSFKTRAIQVKNGLEKGAPGITVLLNPEKPRRGCFEIREEEGEKFISLLDLKRPFTKMKELDMDKVISDIIKEIK